MNKKTKVFQIAPKSLLIFGVLLLAYLFALNITYKNLSAEHLKWLLKPTSKIVELSLGVTSNWIPSKGYKLNELPIIIEKSCSGFMYLNIMLLLSAILIYLGKTNYKRNVLKIAALPMIIYSAVILINSFRIITSIGIEKASNNFSWFPDKMAHEFIGVFYFLLGLFGSYFFLQKLIHLNILKWKS